MSPVVRFLVTLFAGLGLLTWLTFSLATRVTWSLVDRELTARSALAVSGARQSLQDSWSRADFIGLTDTLRAMSHDERVTGVRACDTRGNVIATVGRLPATDAAACTALVPAAAGGDTRTFIVRDAGARLHVTNVPIGGGPLGIGAVAIAQDVGFLDRALAQMRWLAVGAFGVLSIGASLLTLTITRLSWRGWNREMRAALTGNAPRPEFAPLMHEVRDLVRRITDEEQADTGAGPWGPERLRGTLQRHLHGEHVIIVANREPYIHHRDPDGSIHVQHPASGLVTALEPVLRACSGVWIAHGAGSADRETADANGRLAVPPGEDAYTLRRLWLTEAQERGYYYGFSNEGLWPLCHVAHTRPTFRVQDFEHYKAVNLAFARAVCEEARQDDPVVLVQDYHFALLPRLVRERLPRATILTFWHVPWPNAERVGICPWADEMLRGLLGSSIMGFHTQQHCNNFFDGVDRLLEARLDRERFAVHFEGHATLVRPYPISIEWPNHWVRTAPPVAECRREIIERLGLPPGVQIGVGVDRLDYTKGIEERLLAVEHMLERHPELIGRFVFVQLAAPSRSAIADYREVDARVAATAARINDRLAIGAWRPIALLREHHEPPLVFKCYRAADVCYVSSLHDGMNLVAKEFIAARDDERGVLVLSVFAGAARELNEALIVNPYNLEEASGALAAALRMPAEEQRDRMRAMRAYLSEFNVYRWAGRMLVDAARVRRQEQLAGRLSRWRSSAA